MFKTQTVPHQRAQRDPQMQDTGVQKDATEQLMDGKLKTDGGGPQTTPDGQLALGRPQQCTAGRGFFGLVEQQSMGDILLNFTNVEFLSSAALGKLITLDRKVKTSKGRMKMCNIRPEIFEVFQITKLNKVFDTMEEVGWGQADC